MNLDKVYKLLNIDSLDESTESEVQTYLKEMIDAKAKERAKEVSEKVINETKEELVEEYENKFEEYKDDITEKFSNFVDGIMDEELEIPEKLKEYARKGELYDDLIEQFKIRLGIDEGAIDNEARNIMSEAKSELEKLKEEKNKLYSEKLQLESDAREFATNLYLHEKCKGLTDDQKEKVFIMLDGVTDRNKIDEKFDFIYDNILNDNTSTENKEEDTELNESKGSEEVDESFNKDSSKEEEPFQKHINSWLSVSQRGY